MAFPDEAFFALVPVQALTWEPGAEDTVVLLRPKILSSRWTWLVLLMDRPQYRVRLDARGTAIWRACDGAATVAQIVETVAKAFPEASDPVRTALFIRELARGGFIRLEAAPVS